MILDPASIVSIHRHGPSAVGILAHVSDPTDRVAKRYAAAAAAIGSGGDSVLLALLQQTDALLARRTDWTPCQRRARMESLISLAGSSVQAPAVSIVINTADEGPRLRQTIAAMRSDLQSTGTGHEFVVVVDGPRGEFCANLGPAVRVLDSSPDGQYAGCAAAKLIGARAATADVLIFMDAHHTVERGHVSDLVTSALSPGRAPCIVCPLLMPIRYRSDWTSEPTGADPHIPNDAHVRITGGDQYLLLPRPEGNITMGRTVAGVTAMTRSTYELLGGWLPLRGRHGSQELGMSLRAAFAGVPVYHHRGVILGHEFRSKWPYPAPDAGAQARNLWQSWLFALGPEDFSRFAAAVLRRRAPAGESVMRDHNLLREAESWHSAHCRTSLNRDMRLRLGLSECDNSHPRPHGTAAPANLNVCVPYAPERRLGEAYNLIMAASPPDSWTMFMDHDVLLLADDWHGQVMRAIAAHPEAGLLTCYTNRMRSPTQVHPQAPQGDDIGAHRAFALTLAAAGFATTDVTDQTVGGMVTITSHALWKAVGGFMPGFLGVDEDYARRVRAAGKRIVRIDSLYVYHARYTNPCPGRGDCINPKSGSQIATVVTTHAGYMQWCVAAMRSIDRQSVAPAERLLVIDGEEDSLPAPDYAIEHGWRVLWHQSGTPGPGRNLAVRNTASPWIQYLDADNVLPSGYLALAEEAAAAAGIDVAVIYPDILYCDADLEPVQYRRVSDWNVPRLEAANYIDSSSLWRRQLFSQGVSWSMDHREDWRLALAAHRAGWRGQRLDCALHYRLHANNRHKQRTST